MPEKYNKLCVLLSMSRVRLHSGENNPDKNERNMVFIASVNIIQELL